jgi:hypothetical protein
MLSFDAFVASIRIDICPKQADIASLRHLYGLGLSPREAIRLIRWEAKQDAIAKSIACGQISHYLGEE